MIWLQSCNAGGSTSPFVAVKKISMPGRGGARKRVAEVPPEDGDYQLKRQRNNAAVNKTRQKKRQEETDTAVRVDEMRKENAKLERKVESLQRELQFLKEMFVAYANNNKKDGAGGSDQPPSGGPAAPSS
uniref:BZIP domain-containing protein n=1 Tax=Steinernema glaseri TaxID=37863 RepID=A0A1I8A2K6_9BILA